MWRKCSASNRTISWADPASRRSSARPVRPDQQKLAALMPAKTAIAAELHRLHHTPLQRSALNNIAFSSDQKTRNTLLLTWLRFAGGSAETGRIAWCSTGADSDRVSPSDVIILFCMIIQYNIGWYSCTINVRLILLEGTEYYVRRRIRCNNNTAVMNKRCDRNKYYIIQHYARHSFQKQQPAIYRCL